MRKTLVAALAAALLATPSYAADPEPQHYVGSLHAHSAYSDGWPGTRPADYYASGKSYGLDFFGGSEHSENMGIPLVFSEACYGEGRGGDGEVLADQCTLADQQEPANSFRKWEATLDQARAASGPDYSAFRGFEWSSDRFGHINVFFSTNWTSAYTDGGMVDMETFWQWFNRPATAGGGSDGIATFNHPDAKKLSAGGVTAPGVNWNDFAYVPAADERMVGIEIFNDTRNYDRWLPYALDKGWHVGAVGAEDLGHRKPPLDNWGGPQWAKTIVLAHSRAPEAIRAAMLDRRFYAVGAGENALRLEYKVDGAPMGSRLVRARDQQLAIEASVNDPAVVLELMTSGGQVVATGTGTLSVTRPAAPGEKYYFVRARRGDKNVAYSSPVWVRTATGASEGEWLAGDNHAHTCYSHDVWCPPSDDNTGPDTFYSSLGTVGQRFTEAAVKGLDYLFVSDHDDIRAHSDPDFGSNGVLGLHGYETSIRGHAQMLGARQLYDKGDGTATAVNAMADALVAAGGAFQANHPSYKSGALFNTCAQAAAADNPLHWRYGYDVQPDSIEVWNPTQLLTPAERYWECWLQRDPGNVRIGLTGGSDTHGATQPTLGNPTTWVFAAGRSEQATLDAIRAGRTTVTRLAPSQGGGRLLLEADGDGNGSFESFVGDAVKPGSKLRVVADGFAMGGRVRVRFNGRTIHDTTLAPGQPLVFTAPDEPGWVRASMYLQEESMDLDPGCRPLGSIQAISTCSADLAVAAMTSPIYLVRAPDAGGDPPDPDPVDPQPDPKPGDPPPAEDPGPGGAQDGASTPEPDDDNPMRPAEQSPGGATMQQVRGERVRSNSAWLRFRILRRTKRGLRIRIAWAPPGERYDVQVRRGGKWRRLVNDSRRTSIVATIPRGALVRVRIVRPFTAPGPWKPRRAPR